ncbi:hypothetical protein HYALB_00007440 [Hymenoscyphus albidus]|uniref:Uncharacterized protein n=1 Tax=Hymenoscyphus albidus TaxID=595503 RepID=A0A9N9QD95_9HELO|nr:hypothetical protein HYALB_00007440 [Hymenoscyphus albidus]
MAQDFFGHLHPDCPSFITPHPPSPSPPSPRLSLSWQGSQPRLKLKVHPTSLELSTRLINYGKSEALVYRNVNNSPELILYIPWKARLLHIYASLLVPSSTIPFGSESQCGPYPYRYQFSREESLVQRVKAIVFGEGSSKSAIATSHCILTKRSVTYSGETCGAAEPGRFELHLRCSTDMNEKRGRQRPQTTWDPKRPLHLNSDINERKRIILSEAKCCCIAPSKCRAAKVLLPENSSSTGECRRPYRSASHKKLQNHSTWTMRDTAVGTTTKNPPHDVQIPRHDILAVRPKPAALIVAMKMFVEIRGINQLGGPSGLRSAVDVDHIKTRK